MAGKGAAHIFVYYQKPGKFVPETGEWEQVKNGNKEFIVTEGKIKFKSLIRSRVINFLNFF